MHDEERKQEKPKQPENMVVYDPDRVTRPTWHACVVLQKVNDALHGEDVASFPTGEDQDYNP